MRNLIMTAAMLAIAANPVLAQTRTSTAASASNAPGVTDDSILLGQSAAFSGPAARLGESMREGAMTYFEVINKRGGVHGRKIKLTSLDDGYEPDRAVANTKRLIAEDKVFALFGYVGTPTSYAVLPLVSEGKIPFFGPFTGAEGLRQPFNRYVFNIRASYFDETEELVNWLISKGKKKIAVFYQDDSYGKAGLDGVTRAMERRKIALVATGTVQRNTVDVDDAIKSIAKAKPDAVIMISAYKSCAAFIQAYRSDRETLFLNVSFVGSEALATELGDIGIGVIISQVVPYYGDPNYAVAMEFSRELKAQLPDRKPSFNNLEGYIAAKAIVEGLERTGRDLTRDKFIAALETFNRVDVGRFFVTFSPDNHNGSNAVLLTTIVNKKGVFLPFWAAQPPSTSQTPTRRRSGGS